VLAIVQEKVNNPSPDDPFEPDIAAVRLLFLSSVSAFGYHFRCVPQLLKNDKTKFLATAKEWTKK
jgi:ubiquitin-conjugating enzyme E2 D/E